MSSTIEYCGNTEYTNPKAISRVSPSVVKLSYYKGVYRRDVNGTLFSCIRDPESAQFISYILTSSKLFDIPDDMSLYEEIREGDPVAYKLDVCLPTSELYEGVLVALDAEIKIVVIKIKSDHKLPVATLTPFTDRISASPFGVSESYAAFCLSPYPTKVSPGDELTVVCTEFGDTSHTLAFSAIYCVEGIKEFSNSRPFLRIHCQHIKDGAPVINCEGDVIGVAFNYYNEWVDFLPINIFLKWWKHVWTYGEICRPWMGVSITNLYAMDISNLEAVVHDCDVYDGVLIDKAIIDSPAGCAGIRPNDVICQCDGRPVRSLLEFIELLWDKSGRVIEAKGVRNGRHFVWEVEIKAIKAGMLPEAGVLPEWLVAKSLAENVVAAKKKSTKRGKNKAKDRKKATKRGKNKAKVRKKAKKDKAETRLMARTRKRNSYSDSVAADERKKSKCSNT